MQQVAEQPAPIEPVATSVTAFIDCFCDGPLDRAVRIAGIDDFERTFGGFDPPSEASYALDQFFCNGGRQTWVVRTQAADGSPPDAAALIGDSAAGTGLHALDEADFNLLCMPRAANTTGASADLTAQEARAVIGAAIAYCERRRALFLVDPPVGVADAREMAGWLEHNPALRHPNTALYYPRVRVADPLDGLRLRTLGASGTIAGLVARIDRARGVWEAPSGSEAVLHGVSELAHELTDEESGVLGRLGINPLRGTPQGIICWGARTLAGADGSSSEWRYVPVRRLALMLEESLERGTRWAMFEPNDEPLWSRLRVATGAFMDGLFRQGAFRGTRPQDAYFVRCDAETTTQADIERGVVNILVGFAPLRPAEFVVLRIEQSAGGRSYEAPRQVPGPCGARALGPLAPSSGSACQAGDIRPPRGDKPS